MDKHERRWPYYLLGGAFWACVLLGFAWTGLLYVGAVLLAAILIVNYFDFRR